MTGSKIQSFDLFKAAMGNLEYLTEINKDRVSQAKFLTALEEGELTIPDILESIQIVKNQQAKSLLIIYLLSQKEYLSCLKGDSLLNRLTLQDHHIPSRLNALVHQLDLKILSTQLISKLEPEAAISILCSVPHFHQLTKIQVEALLERYPLFERHKVLTYWINHFASMPNAHYILAHFMSIAGPNVIEELGKMEPNQKEAVVVNIIENLGLFHNIPNRFLEHANKESHLLLAIRLYLNGHYNKAYASYINQLTKRLLDKNHSFSLDAIELLFFLNDKLAFKELATRTAYFTNRYLRNNALKGNVALFYQNKRINIQRMLQNIHLNPPIPEIVKEQMQSVSSDESPFVGELIKRDKSINCFEYFLIHYKGSSEPIVKLLDDYMEFYERSVNIIIRNKAIHHIGFMLRRPEIDETVKEAIFSAFLNHPILFDEQVSYQLFLFDAKRVIRYFGLRGGKENYQRVIDLCTLALKNLNSEKNQEIIQIAQKALSEAQLELNFSNEYGFFSDFIKWIKRCWIYGWTGFFKPNAPNYVAPESVDLEENNASPSSKRAKSSISAQELETDLLALLNVITLPLTQDKFEEIIKALDSYSLQTMPKNELITRQKLHRLYHYAMTHKEENEIIYHWLKDNQNPFIVNQFRLLELMLREKSRDEIDSLLTQFNEDSDQLQYVSDELDSLLPELVVTPTPKHSKSAETSDFVASATKILSKYTCEATVYAQSALNWAEGFFTKMKKSAQEEEEAFEVEHIESFQKIINSKGTLTT
ncbi:Dot/Icm secretion system substrate [Legionella steigerwaltii]|uniref:Dot/Icm T4SS effector n=1 Tax=Legionella steigerwaltii TaxID=460 RepID=A0A378L856_9GAMM|nr:hypothetical protein [Legionella steigerwaltii]KTD72110.1 Dot/Icm T4SS effector [Legionella steigerwaltii]STY21869.1 Dot/Icm secretion system substrate [Legionella steigerwaltii]